MPWAGADGGYNRGRARPLPPCPLVRVHQGIDLVIPAQIADHPLPPIGAHLSGPIRVIEQFDGYFGLEDIRPRELRKRLIDPDEYWGWPNGIAVNTQVLKQADVIQLLAMLDIFPREVLTANYEYYEPRTEHGSSLSPSVHALVASRAGHPEEAYRYFLESASIDLYNASKKVIHLKNKSSKSSLTNMTSLKPTSEPAPQDLSKVSLSPSTHAFRSL